VIRNVCLGVFALVMLVCGSSSSVGAQTAWAGGNPCQLYLTANDLGADLGVAVPPGAIQVYENTVLGLGGESTYAFWRWVCPPPAAPSETCPTCGNVSGGGSGDGGSADGGSTGGGDNGSSGVSGASGSSGSISLASGNTNIHQSDLRIPGLGGGLRLKRTWNSLWPATQSGFQIGLFGPNWRSTYEERVFVGADNYIKYGRSDGSFWSFGWSSYGTYIPAAPQNVTATLVWSNSGGPWTLTFQNGEQRLFDNTSGKLTAIIDRNGNITTLSYDSLGRLATVTDPASRHLYFNYSTGTGSLVTSVTTDVGLTVTYSYDSNGRLTQVTEPDGSTLAFQYDANSFVSAVLDSQGKILESHTYDTSGRGLTSSRANGVDAITVSYGNP